MGRYLDQRRRAALARSKKGSNRVMAGTNKAVTVSVLALEITLSAAMEKPRNMLPESPRKIEAGLKLKTRNPKTAPERHKLTNIPISFLKIMLTASRVRLTNNEIPAARPSRPSKRLIAFIQSMNQKTVTGKPKGPRKIVPPNGFDKLSILKSPEYAMVAIRN
jgi:hypothetical protein